MSAYGQMDGPSSAKPHHVTEVPSNKEMSIVGGKGFDT